MTSTDRPSDTEPRGRRRRRRAPRDQSDRQYESDEREEDVDSAEEEDVRSEGRPRGTTRYRTRRRERSGFRIPTWLVVMVLLIIALVCLFFAWHYHDRAERAEKELWECNVDLGYKTRLYKNYMGQAKRFIAEKKVEEHNRGIISRIGASLDAAFGSYSPHNRYIAYHEVDEIE